MIFYFSGTGNTRWAAERLAEITKEKLVYIPDVIKEDPPFTIAEDERIGFIFPVHGWRPPKLVRKFIEKLKPTRSIPKGWNGDTAGCEQPYVYALCTAGDSIGKTIEILSEDLQTKGLQLNAAFSLIMPESYVGLPFMDVDPKENELRKKAKAHDDLMRFEQDIINRKHTAELVKGPIPWFFSGPVGSFFVNHLVTDKRFHVEEERCIRCGKCAEVCPVHDIEGGKGLVPKWKHNGKEPYADEEPCLTCFTCYHHCPTHAIEFGRQTQKKGQYYYMKQGTRSMEQEIK